MKLPEAARQAIRTGDAQMAFSIVCKLNERCGYNWRQSVEFFAKNADPPPGGDAMTCRLAELVHQGERMATEC